ncbi:DUF4097 family beta strand repeat-containing protein [Micromonospora sp. NPDC047548]|uniref:DUF4097 family beta strand repeat-containing protein n=1 Tax=Micromonospora sp. NPDC047548 TaxID=3155624 RepID=UPI00340BE609
MNKVGWIVVGAIVTVVAIAAGIAAVWLVSSRGPDQTEVQQHTEQRIPERLIFVDFEASDVRVVGGDYDEVRIERTLKWDRTKPRVTETWSGTTLQISHDCQDNTVLSACSVDYFVQLPANVAIQAETSSGDVSVDGLTGRIKLDVVSGDVEVKADSTAVDVHATSGAVTVSNGASGASIETVSGEIRAEFTAAPGTVRARSTSGDVTIHLPAPADGYRLDIKSVSGDQDVSLPSAPTGDRTITVETVSGDIRVG